MTCGHVNVDAFAMSLLSLFSSFPASDVEEEEREERARTWIRATSLTSTICPKDWVGIGPPERRGADKGINSSPMRPLRTRL